MGRIYDSELEIPTSMIFVKNCFTNILVLLLFIF